MAAYSTKPMFGFVEQNESQLLASMPAFQLPEYIESCSVS
jgi:hypothetical protein